MPLFAQGTLGERLTGFDITTLPGAGNKSARGVCSDGETLWVVEERALKLFAYALASDVPTRHEDGDIQLDFYENYGPSGCASDGTTIWVADDEFDKLIAYDIASKARDSDNDIDTLGAAGNNRVGDVALHGATVWVVDSQDKALYAYELQGGARDGDKDIALHTTDMNPTGLWTDGTTMWVADSLSGHFFAYDLVAGTRDTTKEFAATDSTNLQGIWSNGRVLWAANRADGSDQGNKVLAYRMPATASADASLSALSLSGVALTPAFASGTTAYAAVVGHGVTETTVTATASDGNASVEVTPVDADDETLGDQVNLAVGETTISVAVTAEDGETGQSYTVTVTRARSADATLSALSLSGVTLTPVFASGTTAYTASVANRVTETTVTATVVAGAAYEVKLNGVVDHDGIVGLVVGSGNVIAVVVTAQDGEMTQTYSVTVTRAGSADASLSALSLSGVTLTPAFVSVTTAYTASVANSVTETTVTATARDENASVEVTPEDADDQTLGDQVALAVGETTISVEVTAQDGVTTQTYLVTVTQAESADASLSALSLSGVTLMPAFASGTTAYAASVANTVTETTVTATVAAEAAYEVKLNGVVDEDGIVGLVVGSGNVIAVVVTAGDGETTQTYMVTVTRAGSSDASLSALLLSGVTLSPAFASGTVAYTASVANSVTETTVAAPVSDGSASVEVKVNGVVNQDGVVGLAVGDGNVIAVEVTAEDGQTKQIYTVTVTRAGSAAATLSALSLSGVTLTPAFASGTTAYTASVANSATETTVMASASDANASVEVTPEDADDQTFGDQVALAVGETTISVAVTAQDGETTQTYTVAVTRAGSVDATLSALSLSGVTLTPAFASGTTTYAASVGHGVTETTVTASASDAYAGVEVTPEDADDRTLGDQVDLAVGETTISVEVTAQDGLTTRTYMVTVTRAGSADAILSALSLSGVTLSPAFASGTTAYSASVANSETETTVAATAAAGAAYEVKLNDVVDQDGVVGLAVGSGNVITVVVTAEDGETTQTYMVTVTRAGSADAILSALSLSGVTLSPAFASGTTAYSASVANSETETTVAATAAAGAAYEVKLNDVVDQDGVVGLAVGSGNVITVVVTAEDGETTQTYTVTVTRAGSSEARLRALSLSGVTLTPDFASGTTAYTASVANSVTETTVAAAAAAGAAYEVKLNGVVDQDGVVPLAVGSGNVIAVVVTAQDGKMTQTYSVTVTRAGSSDATLSALSLSGVTLTSVFASGTTAYTASAANSVTETTVTATAAAEAAYEVKLNGVVDHDGVVGLEVGDGNVIAVEVTAQDGETTQTYTVTVTRAGSADATLSALSLSGVTLTSVFASGTTAYTASVANSVTETTVTATAAAEAAYEVKLNGVVDHDGVVGLEVGDGNVIAVEVTAQDGETTQTYTVTVTRAGSADASLSALSLSGVTLTSAFASGTIAYTASVANSVTETTVTATARDENASVEVTSEDADDQTLGDQVALAVGETTVAIEVIAEDGETTRTYMVTVTRAGSANASLSSLSLSGVTLKPVFASGVTVYTASVANSVTETTVTATAVAGAGYEVKLNGVVDQDRVVPLVVGSGNVIVVVVTAQDGQTKQIYTVAVTRAGSADATLSALSLSGVTLTPAFAAGTTAYAASVGHAVTESTVTATASDANASVEVKLNGVVDQDGVTPLVVGSGNVIAVVVTAQDGVTTQTYTVTVTVTRAGSSDATLSALSLSGVTLSPVFASGTTAYTAAAGHGVTETTVTVMVAAGAAYEVKLNGVVDQDGVAPLVVGSGNVIAVVVTAQDGQAKQTYTVTVTRAGSSEASLSGLSLMGNGGEVVVLTPAFASRTTAYTAEVAHDVSAVTVSATVASAGSAYEIRINGVMDQDGVVGLAVGAGNVIAVVVTAQDGKMTQTYSVTVTRAGSSDATLSALSLSGVTLTPAFAAGTTAYTAAVGHDVSAVTVTALVASAGAAFEVKLNGIVDQDGIVPLAVGSGNVIAVVVTAQDGEMTQTYSVTVTRAGSADATLSGLSLMGDGGEVVVLTPAFASRTTAYTAEVAHNVSAVTVAATVASAGSAYEIRINGIVDQDGIVPLAVGADNVITVIVTAQDGKTTQTYTVTVTRAGSSEASLSGLSLSGDGGEVVALSPAFASGTTAYTAAVAHDVSAVAVTVSVAAGAAYEVKLNGVMDQDGVVPLAVGAGNVVAVVVTAQDGESSQTYTVMVTRAGSADASLSALSLSGVTLTPVFASGTTVYTASVANSVTVTTVTATAVAGAVFEVELNGIVDQDGIVPLAVGADNVITVIVTAQDGESSQTYTVTVTRAGSSEASLSGLLLMGDGGEVVALSPVFASGTTAYIAAVAHDVSAVTVTVTASVASAGSAYEIRLNGVVDQDGVVPLAVGAYNVITVIVTAQDGESSQTYTVTVTRAGSSEASLSGLSLSGDGGEVVALSPVFVSGTTAYIATAAHAVSAVTVTASVASAGSAYEVRLNGVMDQDGVVPLAVGAGNVITVIVTAQNGETTQTYTVTVTRAGYSEASLSSLSLSGVALSPAFAAGTTAYSASVANSVMETTVTAIAAAGAAFDVRLNGVVDQDGVVPLGVGSGNVIAVEVTAQNGESTQTYTVTVTRAGSGDATLSGLTLMGDGGEAVALAPAFASGTTAYAATVAHDVRGVTVVAQTTHSLSSVSITPADANGGTEGSQVNLVVGVNVITVAVLSQDGKARVEYIVEVERQSEPNVRLKSLNISQVPLSPAFDPAIFHFTATVEHEVHIVTVEALPDDPDATVDLLLDGEVDRDGVLALPVGASVIEVVVTAKDAAARQTYTVMVTRKAEELVPLPTPVRPVDRQSPRPAPSTPTPTPTATAIPRGIGISTSAVELEVSSQQQSHPEATLTAWNRGSGRMILNVSDDAGWLRASPGFVVSTGPQDRQAVTLIADAWLLRPGTHTATVYVSVNELPGPPETVSVTLTIAPGARPTPTPTATATATPTPTLTPSPTATATPSPTAAPLPTVAPQPTPSAAPASIATVAPSRASPSPTPQKSPPAAVTLPLPTPAPTPIPLEAPAAGLSGSASVLVGSEDAPAPVDDHASSPTRRGNADDDAVSQPSEQPYATESFAVQTAPITVLYRSPGTMYSNGPWGLLLGFFAMDVITKLRRKRKGFLE